MINPNIKDNLKNFVVVKVVDTEESQQKTIIINRKGKTLKGPGIILLIKNLNKIYKIHNIKLMS